MATYSLSQLQALASQAGLSGNAVKIAAAIAMAESGGNTQAYNPETAAGTPVGHGSRGLWQIYGYAHPQYDSSAMFDPVQNSRAMFAISSGGTNWNPWSTYKNGQYKAYLSDTSTVNPVKSGHSNAFPMGQCTWWADQHYHDLTGYYVPWNGNAYQWTQGARSSGWQVSNIPPNGIPSIIVMAPNVQGAGGLGHVGVVEHVNSNGTVTVSNMNWTDPNAAVLQTVSGYPIRQTTIRIDTGIMFVWATGSGTSSTSLLDFPVAVAKKFNLAPNADVKAFLASMDEYLTLSSIFDVDTTSMQDSALGVNFTDPVKWLGAVATNSIEQMVATLIRLILVILGVYLLIQVIRNFVDGSGSNEDSSSKASQILPFLQPLMGGGAAGGAELAAAAVV